MTPLEHYIAYKLSEGSNLERQKGKLFFFRWGGGCRVTNMRNCNNIP